MKILSEKTITRYTIRYREDGILNGHISKGEWSPADYKILHPAIGEMVNYRKVPLLLTYDKFVFPGSEEIARYAKEEFACPYFKVDGIVTNSLPLKILGNFFLTLHRPLRPTKLFENEEEAVVWLKRFL